MLRNTFIHIPGVGPETEIRLWNAGILSWDDFISNFRELPLSSEKKNHMRQHIEESILRLKNLDHRYFARRLPRSEIWRAYPEFLSRVAFLDIETTGLFPHYDEITIIGIYDGKKVHSYINGQNLGTLEKDLGNYSLIVTFNGLRFDIPFIQKFFPHIRLDHIHIDLLYPLRRLGYRGGLKAIEKRLGVSRDEQVAGITGFDAVRLWREYKKGNTTSLDLLVKYNAADIVNLEYLMWFCYEELKKRVTGIGKTCSNDSVFDSSSSSDGG